MQRSRTQNFFCTQRGAGVGSNLEAVHKLCSNFKTCVTNFMSKSPGRHLVRLQGKLKHQKNKFLQIRKFLSHFQHANILTDQLLSVAYLGLV